MMDAMDTSDDPGAAADAPRPGPEAGVSPAAPALAVETPAAEP
eukprot:CAMPEP_0119266542 /NCGR_PEP_ID=MMETSP1329-20130426/5000_1 /TAXON_ID=114041 /ORGANISM="Genus nov. species nov., Strain RCC1024" /LENGTH=42 /DNA_ID= /DNA_START= /DNA_END= /DNA_ORIENTATION=